ncbi:MAG: response regulator, partial [Acidobacteria bacterium]|nr:response regulator [Acidobacteriota bacterium]
MSTALRLLLVEDSPDDAELLVRELRRGGYDVAFQRVDSAEAMSTALTGQKWDLVIADFSMPHFSGTAALRLVRERDSDLPFIFVSGTIGEDTAVAAMKDGAHDYIMKGNMRRLIPAIERELRDAETRRERRRVTDALKRSETQYRELVENATYGIYRSTPEGRFLDVNPSLVKMLGYGSKEEVLALNIASDVW